MVEEGNEELEGFEGVGVVGDEGRSEEMGIGGEER